MLLAVGTCALVYYLTRAMIGRNTTNHNLEKKKAPFGASWYHSVLCSSARCPIGTKHFPESKTLPRIHKHFPERKTLPRIQNTSQIQKHFSGSENTSQNPKHLPKSKTLPRIPKHFPECRTLPRIQNTSQNPDPETRGPGYLGRRGFARCRDRSKILSVVI